MSKCPNVQMSKCPNVQMSKCPNVQMCLLVRAYIKVSHFPNCFIETDALLPVHQKFKRCGTLLRWPGFQKLDCNRQWCWIEMGCSGYRQPVSALFFKAFSTSAYFIIPHSKWLSGSIIFFLCKKPPNSQLSMSWQNFKCPKTPNDARDGRWHLISLLFQEYHPSSMSLLMFLERVASSKGLLLTFDECLDYLNQR